MDLVKSKQRVADHGEVLTPPELVEAMLDLVAAESEHIDSRFHEPACGSGNFLVPGNDIIDPIAARVYPPKASHVGARGRSKGGSWART